MIVDIIKKMLENHESKTDIIKIGYIKEFLQSEVLEFIYRHKDYKNLIFYGGTAMRFLLGLNRLSEDMDFIGQGSHDFESLGKDIKEYFLKQKGIELEYKLQKFRVTLKFRGFLDNFGLQFGHSKDLYLKIEISDHFDFCKRHTTKDYPVLYQDKSMIIHSLDPSTLFSTKLNAVLYRQRSQKKATSHISIKGRDFYDLFRYLQKDIVPNIDCILSIESMSTLKSKIIEIVNNTNFGEVVQDITPFLEDTAMLDFIENNGKEYILEKVRGRKNDKGDFPAAGMRKKSPIK